MKPKQRRSPKKAVVLALANTKGGVGKSTAAGNLAWAFATRDRAAKVLLIDADVQASVTRWFDLAPPESVPFDRIQLTTARSLQAQVPRLRHQYQLVVIDCPPMQSDITAAAMISSDMGLIPVQPSPLDVMAYGELLPLLQQAQGLNPKLKLRFVVNQLAAGTILAREVIESLAEFDIPMTPTPLHARQAYRKVVAEGLSVVTRQGPACDEVMALAAEVLNVLQAA